MSSAESQPASQPAGFWNRRFAAGSLHEGAKIARTSARRPPYFLSISLATPTSFVYREKERARKGKKKSKEEHLCVEHNLGRKERVRRGVTCNVKLSWLNTGQIYRTIDAFGPLQPAVVDISLRPRIISHAADWSYSRPVCEPCSARDVPHGNSV